MITNGLKENKLSLSGKRVLVMGLGLHGGGVGTVKFLAKHGAIITVTDLRRKEELLPSLNPLKKIGNIKYVLGKHNEKDFLHTDLIIKNPGVRPDNHYLKKARAKGIPITTDVGIFFKISKAPIIGVTGTRGKSTTSSLIAAFLRHKFPRVFLGGNIRKSVLEFLDKVGPADAVVLELSSFQLTDLAAEKTSPHIAVMTNIMRDHLNWHLSMSEYISAKSAIFRFQRKSDYLFINPEDSVLKKISKNSPGGIISPMLPTKFKHIVDTKFGAHFRQSIGLAVAVAKYFNIPDKVIKKEINSFSSLEGRQEIIAKKSGVTFINDTTATIPDAAIAAIERFSKNLKKPAKLVLIAGGSDKKLDFTGFIKAINKNVGTIIFLPGTATNKLQIISNKFKIPMKYARTMKEAVQLARLNAKSGDIILLSPGAASFGLFLNEFDRGVQFTREVKNG